MATRAETIRAIERAVSQNEKLVARSFMDAVRSIRELHTLQALEEALERGSDAVLALFSQRIIEAQHDVLAAAITSAVVAGASTRAATLDAVVGPIGRVEFVSNAANPALGAYARSVSATRVREVSNDVQAVIRDVVRAETLAGTNPRTAARRIKDSIGLTRRQEQAVLNYRRDLESGNMDALRRALRDRRFDSSVRRAIANDRPLSAEQIDKMVNRYHERFVRYRSEVIGRTEALRAVNGGAEVYLEEQVREGRLDARQIRREWIYTRDDRTRDSHKEIPDMNPDGVGINEAFQTPDGPLRFPGDPSGPPRATVQCRCKVFPRVVSLELVT